MHYITSATARKIENRKERDVEGVARYRAQRGLEISERLEQVAIDSNSSLASGVAFRLRRCAEGRNLWTAEDLHRGDGECFNGLGNLYSCGSRLCPSCVAVEARGSRKKGRAGIERLKGLLTNKTRWRLRFRSIVLTMPLMEAAFVTDSIQRINKAFRRLINREFWKTRVKGGFKAVEFTVRPKGYHVHIHLLVLSDFIPVNAAWEKHWEADARKHGLHPGNLAGEFGACLRGLGVALDGSPNVAVYDVRRRGEKKKEGTKSLEEALQETCKYLTKSESWDKIPDSQLLAVAEVKRWPRMFETFGAAKEEQASEEPEVSEVGECPSLVHTHSLSAGEQREVRAATWREALTFMTFDEWCVWMDRRITRAQDYRREQLARKYPYARFRNLDGYEWDILTVT